jgi:hypothetical protein
MKSRFATLCLLSLQTVACSAETGDPLLMYRGDFDANLAAKVTPILAAIADQHGMRLFEKDAEQMSVLTQDQPAFFLALNAKENPVLILTNVGAADILTLSVERSASMADSELQALACHRQH